MSRARVLATRVAVLLLALGVLAPRIAHAQVPAVPNARVARLRTRCARAVEPDWNRWALASTMLAVGAGWTVAGFADPAQYDSPRVGLMQGLGLGTAVSSLLLAIRLGAPEPIDTTSACRRLRAVRAHSAGELRAALRVERQLHWLGRYGAGWTRGALITASVLTVVGAGVALVTALGAQPAAHFATVAGAAFGLSLGFWLAPFAPAPGVRAGMDEEAYPRATRLRAAVAPVAGGALAVLAGAF